MAHIEQSAAALNADRLVVCGPIIRIWSRFPQVDVSIAEIGLAACWRLGPHHQPGTIGIGGLPVDEGEVLDQNVSGSIQRNPVFAARHREIQDRSVALGDNQSARIVACRRTRLVHRNHALQPGLIQNPGLEIRQWLRFVGVIGVAGLRIETPSRRLRHADRRRTYKECRRCDQKGNLFQLTLVSRCLGLT